MKRTKIIEFYGGPGSGKSTLAAHLFSALKYRKKSVELVREYAKERLWANLEVNSKVQPVIHGVQFDREYAIIGRTDLVITDSPISLCGIYYNYYSNSTTLLDFIMHHQRTQDSIMSVDRYKIFITRVKDYNRDGRNENESQAKEIDELLKAAFTYDYNFNGCEESIQNICDVLLNKDNE